MVPSMVVAYLAALVVGPALVSADLRNNGLPLYLARPFGRWEYVLGKSAVMLILLSTITWMPGLFLFAFQSYMEGWDWFSSNLGVAVGIGVGSSGSCAPTTPPEQKTAANTTVNPAVSLEEFGPSREMSCMVAHSTPG